ncbi:MAG: uroporphyrinogen-III synthase [Campylobacterales bacterium]|nr:uroporphyrinogen-III synthase [Campylobacterales bacterium]
MPNILRLCSQLNLLYYEYDRSLKTFIVDQQNLKEAALELVTITNLLQKNGVFYTIDARNNIHITKEDSKFSKVKGVFSDFVDTFLPKNHNIYLLSDTEHKQVKKLPVITTKVIPTSIDFAHYDAIVFTSKNAVLSVDSFNKEWRHKPAYVIAPQSAKTVKKLKGQLRYVGKNHYGNEFAEELVTQLQGKKVLYLRAKEVVSSLSDILGKGGVTCDEAIVYETICKRQSENITLPKKSIIIFSSPSTVDCFFLNKEWDNSYVAIAIGKTTAEHLPESIPAIIAESTSIESCIREALRIESGIKKRVL